MWPGDRAWGREMGRERESVRRQLASSELVAEGCPRRTAAGLSQASSEALASAARGHQAAAARAAMTPLMARPGAHHPGPLRVPGAPRHGYRAASTARPEDLTAPCDDTASSATPAGTCRTAGPRTTATVREERERPWRRPIFPRGCPLSIFGAGELDFRVRDGNGYGLSARVTRISCVRSVVKT